MEGENTNKQDTSSDSGASGSREEFRVSGDDVVRKVRELINEGTVRRIIIKNEKGETILEIPLAFALVGAVIAPILAAVGAGAALLTKCTLIVERKETK